MEQQSANKSITTYLLARVEEFRKLFRKLSLLRQEEWSNPEGDDFFAKQRATADTGNPKTARHFYTMMQNI
ncbi:hypothetical protein B0A54_18101, partial [Friedmanniomyces endolithicus]